MEQLTSVALARQGHTNATTTTTVAQNPGPGFLRDVI
jgi:hypothetical protein